MAIQETSAVSSAAVNGKHGHSLISDEKFHQLYALALAFHLAAERGIASLAGHEAALAGVAAGLLPDDVLVSEHALSLIDSAMGMSGIEQVHVQVMSATGSCIVDALSAALADRMRRNHRVTVILSPGETDGQLLDEARAVAASARLPIIFVEQRNEPAMRSSRTKRQERSRVDEPISIPVDAHDVIAMYRVAYESITRARQGSGPTRIVCLSLAAAGDGSRTYRSDAVAKLEQWLSARGLPVQEWRQEITAKRKSRISPEWQESSDRDTVPQNAA